uniref:Uncharacterized protein n=1 Tax=Arundo donax TaxID=35708 RepID=A0A0A8Z664_ARUDO
MTHGLELKSGRELYDGLSMLLLKALFIQLEYCVSLPNLNNPS